LLPLPEQKTMNLPSAKEKRVSEKQSFRKQRATVNNRGQKSKGKMQQEEQQSGERSSHFIYCSFLVRLVIFVFFFSACAQGLWVVQACEFESCSQCISIIKFKYLGVGFIC
jgi:hypothetical protein